MNTIVIGSQWGDEGKGKIVDSLAKDFDIIVRFQGGNNAGHTIVVENRVYKLHLLPSGIISADKICILGNGMVIDPEVLLQEMTKLETEGFSLQNLYISERAHVIMPYHKHIERLEEQTKKGNKIGTTMRGIGPCYTDKSARQGIRMVDLLNVSVLREKLEQIFELKQKVVAGFEAEWPFTIEELASKYHGYGKKLQQHIADTALLINQNQRRGSSILFEGAQGVFLCVDYGTYPFVTSSHTNAGNACCGSGIGPRKIDKVIGVVKAYTTRVGAGSFPTELDDEVGEHLRRQGKEYGTTTGRPRRCGWLDLAMVKYAIMLSGIDEIAITKLDVLQNVTPIKICSSYTYRGEKLANFPADLQIMRNIEVEYEELPGWKEDIGKCRSFAQLPRNCKRYLQRIEEVLEIPIRIISVGPERNQTIKK